jgi:hypothetical protein
MKLAPCGFVLGLVVASGAARLLGAFECHCAFLSPVDGAFDFA